MFISLGFRLFSFAFTLATLLTAGTCALLEWSAVLQGWSDRRELLIPRTLGWFTTAVVLVPLGILAVWMLPAGRTSVFVYTLCVLISIALALFCLVLTRSAQARSKGVQIGSVLLLLLDGIQPAASTGLLR